MIPYKKINTGSRNQENRMEIQIWQQNRKLTKFTVRKYINTYVQNQALVEEPLLGLPATEEADDREPLLPLLRFLLLGNFTAD